MVEIKNPQPIERIERPMQRVVHFKLQQKRKTAHGLILGLNQKFKKDVSKDPGKTYTAQELSLLFGEKVVELNVMKKEVPEGEISVSSVTGDFCASCGQRIKQSFKVGLSKNSISTLWMIHKLMGENKFIETKEIYTQIEKASPTAELTKLKYLGAIYPYFEPADYEKKSKRPGKWAISERGIKFLKKWGKLPSYVLVKDEDVVELGAGIFIDDESLKWMTEDDIWKEMQEHWEDKTDDTKV
jgi:hypothetical protein